MDALTLASIKLGHKRVREKYARFRKRLEAIKKDDNFFFNTAKKKSLGRMGRKKVYHVGMAS